MRVVVPFTRMHPRTRAALPPDAEPYRLPHDDSYYELLARLWSLGRDFAVIEQDIELLPGVLEGLECCPEFWCGQVYLVGGRVQPALGCTRFRAELMAEVPDALERVGRMRDIAWPERDWHRLDVHLATALQPRRIHPHHPEIPHHH